MKNLDKLGYILTIVLTGLFLVGNLATSNVGLGKNADIGQAVIAVVLIVIISGAIAGLMKKPWGKKITIAALVLMTALLALSGNVILAVPSAILLALIFFAK